MIRDLTINQIEKRFYNMEIESIKQHKEIQLLYKTIDNYKQAIESLERQNKLYRDNLLAEVSGVSKELRAYKEQLKG